MAGPAAVDGGRILKAGLLAFGALIWAAPIWAQSAGPDPLAPLPTDTTSPAPQPPQPPSTAPITSQPAPIRPVIAQPSPAGTLRAPKDWRGVFDAIDSGDWAAVRAGIATLPPSILAPVARAELYTAKDSPTVDLGSLQTLLAEAPELPQAQQ